MAEEEGVKLFGAWASPFSLRVRWALKLKGVEYEFVDEDLPNKKSPELLKYNPVTKKIPVLVHHGRPIAESTVIVEFVDEAWAHGPHIMPQDPYERAQARFWARFAEDKCLPAIYAAYKSTGEALQEAIKEVQDVLKTLEKALEGKKFFGGDTIGYLDIIAGWIPCWVRMIEELAGVSMVNANTHPSIDKWFNDFLHVDVVRHNLPPKDKLYEVNAARREQLILEKEEVLGHSVHQHAT